MLSLMGCRIVNVHLASILTHVYRCEYSHGYCSFGLVIRGTNSANIGGFGGSMGFGFDGAVDPINPAVALVRTYC